MLQTAQHVDNVSAISDSELFIPDSFEHAQRLSDGLTEELFKMQAAQKSKTKTRLRKVSRLLFILHCYVYLFIHI